MIELNRRTFLKGAGASSATCALASLLPGSLAALENKQLKGMGKDIASICEMCSTRCPISARVIEGKNVFISGNKAAKSFGGKVCARGGAGHSLLYDPQRIVKPLKRVGERGEGKWAEISWDEAYKLIAENLNKIKKNMAQKPWHSRQNLAHKKSICFTSRPPLAVPIPLPTLQHVPAVMKLPLRLFLALRSNEI